MHLFSFFLTFLDTARRKTKKSKPESRTPRNSTTFFNSSSNFVLRFLCRRISAARACFWSRPPSLTRTPRTLREIKFGETWNSWQFSKNCISSPNLFIFTCSCSYLSWEMFTSSCFLDISWMIEPNVRNKTKYVRTFRKRKTLLIFILNRFRILPNPSSAKYYILTVLWP